MNTKLLPRGDNSIEKYFYRIRFLFLESHCQITFGFFCLVFFFSLWKKLHVETWPSGTVGKQHKKNVCGSVRIRHGGVFYVSVKKVIHEEVSKYEKQYRGKELVGFVNYKTFETIVQQYMGQLVDPAIDMLQKAVGEAVLWG